MTTTGISQRDVAALAALAHSIRPEWNEAGIAAEIRKHAGVPLAALVFAVARAASDPRNETPAALSQDGNRAWNDCWPWRCTKHPDTRSRRSNGECAGCFADRTADENAQMRDRGGVPIPPDARRLIDEAITKRQHEEVPS